jgi:hypothetical protein
LRDQILRLVRPDPAGRVDELVRVWREAAGDGRGVLSPAAVASRRAAWAELWAMGARGSAKVHTPAVRAMIRLGPGLDVEELEALGGLPVGRLEAELTAALLGGAESAGQPGGVVIEDRFAALTLVRRLGLKGLAPRVVERLADADPVGPLAEATLAVLVEGVIAERTGHGLNAERVALAVIEAGERLATHRRGAVVEWLVGLAAAGVDAVARPRGANFWNDADHACTLALRRRLRRDESPASAVAAWRWLNVPTLASACAERLNSVGGLPAGVLEQAHRALVPARVRALAKHGQQHSIDLGTVLPAMTGGGLGLSLGARQGYARLAGAWPVPVKQADAALAAVLNDPEPAVRGSAVLAGLRRGGRPACLLDLSFDADERVARSAALGAVADAGGRMVRDGVRERAVAALRRSPHAAVSAVARGERLDPTRVALPGPMGAGERLALRTHPAGELSTWRGVLVPGVAMEHPAAAERVLGLARAAHMLPVVESALPGLLMELLPRSEPALARLAATVAAVLGEAAGEEAGPVLSAALGALDARVRANAAEGLVRRARRSLRSATRSAGATTIDGTLAMLIDRPADEHHRLRANAARGLLLLGGTPEQQAGVRLLLGLLRDARGTHRGAGLWLTERLAPRLAAWPDVIDAVAHAARASGRGVDGAGTVATGRADRAAKRLIVELRSDWSRRAHTIAGDGPDRDDAEAAGAAA